MANNELCSLNFQGCDGSVLINSTSNNQAEKAATPNLTLRGFDFIDRVKSLVEKECPGVVSCADILALVARDAVGVIGGPFWRVPTGRRDGRISNSTEALNNIPAPTFNFSALQTSFANKGLGAHTIGISHCSSFNSRLYNFTGKGDQDPSLDSFYAANLKKNKCKSPNDNTSITEMDPGSFRTFDLGYYKNVLKRRGLFQSDAALITNAASKSSIINIVSSPPQVFFQVFAASMEKMNRIEVLTGSMGEIRKHCAVVNRAHTIGIGHCSSFSSRLYNFTGKGDQDPSLDKFYAANLKKACKSLNDNVTFVEMDPGSFRTFDLGYYKNVLKRRGLFQSDAALITDAATKSSIISLVNSPPEVFFQEFALSMEKMGRIEVKTGTTGEIRKNCAVVNS
ncbi:hypothetical protein COCNU_12G003560 [Cocos nucifera]|uniref:Peroxidase n=1 Tax=Cocos nucifera TaxID=13894 RepID=A0A8K0IRN9_COCNU|nr:hypothetical protein COCNU_12G003560 [Cocos nucifera]